MAIYTINQYLGYTKNLANKFESYGVNVNKEMAKALTNKIRRRAPSGRTGSLKRIKTKVISNREIEIIGPNHWSFVNQGVSPKKWLPTNLLKEHNSNPGSSAGEPANIPSEAVEGWFYADNKGIGKGFVTDALLSLNKDAAKIIDKEFAKLTK